MSYKTRCRVCGCELDGRDICGQCYAREQEERRHQEEMRRLQEEERRREEENRRAREAKRCRKCGRHIDYDYSGMCQDCYERSADNYYEKRARG